MKQAIRVLAYVLMVVALLYHFVYSVLDVAVVCDRLLGKGNLFGLRIAECWWLLLSILCAWLIVFVAGRDFLNRGSFKFGKFAVFALFLISLLSASIVAAIDHSYVFALLSGIIVVLIHIVKVCRSC
jgi:hypothetical protein